MQGTWATIVLFLVGTGCGATSPPMESQSSAKATSAPSPVGEDAPAPSKSGTLPVATAPSEHSAEAHAVPGAGEQIAGPKYGLKCPDQASPEVVEASIVLIQWAPLERQIPGVKRSKAEALARAQACLNEIRGGKPFGTVVEECSDEPGAAKRAGRLGAFRRKDMLREFNEVAFSLCVGEVSDPVETVLGYTIIYRTK